MKIKTCRLLTGFVRVALLGLLVVYSVGFPQELDRFVADEASAVDSGPKMADADAPDGSLLSMGMPASLPAIGSKSVTSPVVTIYILWGQSLMLGGGGGINAFSGNVPVWAQNTYPVIPRTYIYDKIKRGNPLSSELADNDMKHMGHIPTLQPLTVGYCGTGNQAPLFPGNSTRNDNRYPWEPLQARINPLVGPEMGFAAILDIVLPLPETVVLVKMAVGGSHVVNMDAMAPCIGNLDETTTWHPDATYQGYLAGNFNIETDPYFDTMVHTYFENAVIEARNMFPGQPVRIGGIISLIGFSDSRHQLLRCYEADYRETITRLRREIGGAANASDIPYLILGTPTPDSASSADAERLKLVRSMQSDIADSLANCTYINSAPVLGPITTGHPNSVQYTALGAEMARWAFQQTPFDL